MKKSIAIILLSVGIFLLGEGIFIIIYKSNSSLDNEMNINEEKEPNINEDNVIKYTNVKHLENNEALDKLEAKIKKEKVVEEKRIIDNSKTEELITNNVFSRNLIYDKETHRLTFFKDDVLMGTYTCPTNIDGNDYCYFVNDYLIRNDYNLEEKVEIGQELTDIIVDRYVFLTTSPYSNYFSTNKEHSYVLYDLIESKELGKFTAVKADRQEELDYSKLYDKTDNFRFMLRDENKKWGLVVFNSDGIEEILDYEFDYIGHYSDYYMLVKDNLYYVYNPTTTQIVGPFYNEITQISNNFIVTNEGEYRNNNEKNYRIYTNDGKKIITSAGNKYIEIKNDLFAVVDSENKLSIYKKDGTKIIQDEFQLYGTNYHTRSYNFAKEYSFYKEKETIHIWIKGKDDKEEIYKYNTLTGEKIN